MPKHYDPRKLEEEDETPGGKNIPIRRELPQDDPIDALPLCKQTLEQVMSPAKIELDPERGCEVITLRDFPATLLAVIHCLMQKMLMEGKFMDEAGVFRLLTKLGVSRLARSTSFQLVKLFAVSVNSPYFRSQDLFQTPGRIWRPKVHRQVLGSLADIGGVINMPTDQVAVFAVLEAMLSSERYVASNIVAACRRELRGLADQLNNAWLAVYRPKP